ncbi:MAG: hypothetical protein NC218_06480 [Acetobacter sp.]|nr:hypothetical protein [Acetobacter sp.]
MTEDEKKQTAEEAKKRVTDKLKVKTIETAIVASTLTPTLANAQTAEQSANFPPTPIEQTISTIPSQANIINIDEAENLPTFGSDEWLRDNMKQDSNEHTTTLNDEITALQTAQTAETYNNQLSQPLDMENPEICENMFSKSQVGNISYQAATHIRKPQEANTPQKRPNLKHPKAIYKKEDFRKADMNNFKDAMMAKYANAAFDKDSENITLYIPQEHTQEELNNLLDKGDKKRYEYVTGNYVVEEAIRLHEHSHLEDWVYNGQNTITHPVDIAKADRLTETKAYAVENLYMANQYTLLKQQGIETVVLNDKERPVESLLEVYPNLKETVTQIEVETEGKGFDAQNPDHVRKVVENASDYWHSKRITAYNKQHVKSAQQDANVSNIFEYIQHDDKAFDKVSQQMISNRVYIGNNTNVDLSNCGDLLNTLTTENAQELLSTKKISNIQDVTYGDIQKIDNYLTTQKGLSSTEEKQSYLTENIENIVTRNGSVDENLKQIILNTNNENNQAIVYADNLTEKTDENGHRIISGEKGTVDLTAYQEQQINQNLEATLQQQHQDYKAELAQQTTMLTPSTPLQTQEVSHTIPANTLLNMKQNNR